MSPTPSTTREPYFQQSRRKKRLLLGFALMLFLIAFFWLSGGLTGLLHRHVERLLSERQYDLAEDWLARMLWLRCDSPETYFWQARVSRKLLRIAEVTQLLTKAEQGGFDRDRIRREFVLLEAQTGRIRSVVTELNRMVGSVGQDSAEVCEAYVNGSVMLGNFDVAITILGAWKQEFPSDPQPYYAHSRILEYQQDVGGAVRLLRTAIELDDKHWPSRYALGRILYGNNQIAEALNEFSSAADMRHNAAPLYQKARCLRSLGKLDEARSILAELVQRDESLISASFSRVGEPQYGLPIQLELGTLESALGDYNESLGLLNRVLSLDVNNLDARYARAVVLRQLGRTAESEQDFADVQRARTSLQEIDRLVDEINRSPEEQHIEARCRIGELFIKYENGRHGEFWVKEALNRDPDFAPAHAILAEYYAKLAQKEPAYTALAEEHRREATAVAPNADSPPKSLGTAP